MTHTLDELRLIHVSGPAWLRLLRAREERILAKLYGEFKNGNHDQLTTLAEFASVRDQINEINAALKQYENQKER
jgi:hypothetical protein